MQLDFTNKDAVIAYAKSLGHRPGYQIQVVKHGDHYSVHSHEETTTDSGGQIVWQSGTTMWWISLVNKQGERRIADPIFLVKAETHQEAVALVEARLDREEWPADIYELTPQIVEFDELGPDVAYFK